MKIKLLLCLALAGNLALFAQTPSIYQRLSSSDQPALTLSTDISALMTNKNTDDYQPASLVSADGKKYEVSVKPRGKFRRRIAEIPPLKLKFKKKMLQSEGLDTLNEVKLVLPTSLDEAGNERVVREYLTYRMYEQVSPNHVRAHLINLTLVNTSIQNEAKYNVQAILLEDEEETAARSKGTLLEQFGMTMDKLDQEQAALMAVFQYMVGNTDWSLTEFRNIRLMQTAAGPIVAIPFDFDFCGFVDAPYASPMSDTGLRNVRERFLMAGNLTEEAVKNAAKTLHDHRAGFEQLCRQGLVSESIANKCVKYLESFFKEKL
ncbi:MAG: hypothetical protein ACKVU2_05655 [Saprospiraceae bacterium]